ncbi:MAG: 1,2-phenylacetyl-CoA epoxidase subunit PaaC [Bacteroidia bacterium]|nr:1,2-phenylacetyl-CoA epoxidase subunit PaaC [Bacteroidia bacterium]
MSTQTAPADALLDLLTRLADDDLLLGHRNSEWTGMGPLLEEDIAFASMAQDQIGHALAFYELAHALGAPAPDDYAFLREPNAYKACHFVVAPIGDYAFSLVRHYLYDTAKALRLQALTRSTYAPLAELAQKLAREHKYHQLHGRTWVQQLAQGSDESRLRLQSALSEAYPMALGLFEPTPFTEALAQAGVQPTERSLETQWRTETESFLSGIGLSVPTADATPYLGGRRGYPSEYLLPLVLEMTEVIRQDPQAVW